MVVADRQIDVFTRDFNDQCCILYVTQLRPNKNYGGYQLLRTIATTRTSALKNSSQVDQLTTEAVADLHLTEQEGATTKPAVEPLQSPVCAYNEWDPLEASIVCSPYCDNDFVCEDFVVSFHLHPLYCDYDLYIFLHNYLQLHDVIAKTVGPKLQI